MVRELILWMQKDTYAAKRSNEKTITVKFNHYVCLADERICSFMLLGWVQTFIQNRNTENNNFKKYYEVSVKSNYRLIESWC